MATHWTATTDLPVLHDIPNASFKPPILWSMALAAVRMLERLGRPRRSVVLDSDQGGTRSRVDALRSIAAGGRRSLRKVVIAAVHTRSARSLSSLLPTYHTRNVQPPHHRTIPIPPVPPGFSLSTPPSFPLFHLTDVHPMFGCVLSRIWSRPYVVVRPQWYLILRY